VAGCRGGKKGPPRTTVSSPKTEKEKKGGRNATCRERQVGTKRSQKRITRGGKKKKGPAHFFRLPRRKKRKEGKKKEEQIGNRGKLILHKKKNKKEEERGGKKKIEPSLLDPTKKMLGMPVRKKKAFCPTGGPKPSGKGEERGPTIAAGGERFKKIKGHWTRKKKKRGGERGFPYPKANSSKRENRPSRIK